MVISSVEEMNVLTLHQDYFRLSRPIERRIYEIARKAVGQDETWAFRMTTLHQKSGSKGSLREFRRQMKPIIEGDYLPDYRIAYDEDADLVTFLNRNTMPLDRDRAQADPKHVLKLKFVAAAVGEEKRRGPRYTPLSKRQDRPASNRQIGEE